MAELTKITKLDTWDVDCYQPDSDILKSGVISPVDKDIDVADIEDNIEIVNTSDSWEQPPEIHKIERMKKKGGIDSESIKVTFKANTLPEGIKILHSYYRIRPYVQEPLQCYKCQRMNHTAGSCDNKPRCLLCGGEHDRKQCRVEDETQHKCANCKGPHRANSMECEIFNKAKEIERVKAYTNATYKEAREQVLNMSEPDENSNSRSYRDVLRNRRVASDPPSQVTMTDAAIQTENKICNLSDDQFMEKIQKCLGTILKQMGIGQDDDRTTNIIAKAVKESFDIVESEKESGEEEKESGEEEKEERAALKRAISPSSESNLPEQTLEEDEWTAAKSQKSKKKKNEFLSPSTSFKSTGTKSGGKSFPPRPNNNRRQ